MTKITAINIKNKHKAQYPDISSVSKPIEHSETLPHPVPGMSSIKKYMKIYLWMMKVIEERPRARLASI